jgi:hypothetical protein
MKLFRKVLDRFRQNIVLDELLADMKNLDEVLLEKRLEIFKENVTPEFAKIGLNNWDGKYIWFSDFNNDGVKHVIEYNVFKYYGGSFTFGNCFYSVPTISGGRKLINHRTDKSTKIHFFKRIDEWQKSLENNSLNNLDNISTINEKKFRTTLNDVLTRNIPKLKDWFENTQTLEQNIEGLKNDIKSPPYEIGQRTFSCEYILGFLYKQKGDLETSEYWIKKHFEKELNSDEEMELIMNKIRN